MLGITVCVLVLVLRTVYAKTPVCDSSIFNSITPNDYGLDGALLLYSQYGKQCNVDVFSDAQLDCGNTANPTYTAYSFAIATAGSAAGSAGICKTFPIFEVAPTTIACRQYYPLSTLSSQSAVLMNQIFIAFTITNSVLYYPLIGLEPFTFAFAYTQYGPDTTKSICVNMTNCTFRENRFNINNELCSAPTIDSIYGDIAFLPEQCGPSSDPTTGFVPQDTDQCWFACCAQCGSVNKSVWRRWLLGPVCQAYKFGPPQLRIYGAVFVSTDQNFVANKTDIVPFQDVIVSNDGQISYGNGLGQTKDFISKSRHVRVTLNSLNFGALPPDLSTIPGYLIKCPYGPQTSTSTTCDMGIANPYASEPAQKPPCVQRLNDLLNVSIPPMLPNDATPNQLGVGIVPTANSLGDRGQCSFFFVPNDLVSTSVGMPFGSSINPVSRQVYPMMHPPNISCPGEVPGNTFTDFIGVPGLEKNEDGTYKYTSVCQMSNELNEYATNFLLNYGVTNNVEEAIALTGPLPPYLLPRWNMGAPNWWPHDSGMVFNLGREFPQFNAAEVLVELVDFVYRTGEVPAYTYGLDPASMCTAKYKNGTGGIEIIVNNLFSNRANGVPDNTLLNITCQTIRGKDATIYDVNTGLPLDGNIVNFTLSVGTTSIIGPFNMTYPGSKNYTGTEPFVTCYVELLDNDGNLQLNLTMPCQQLMVNINGGANQNDEEEDDDNFVFYVVIGVIGIVVIIGVVILIGVLIAVALTNAKAKDDVASTKEM